MGAMGAKLLADLGKEVTGQLGQQIGYGIGNVTGYNKRLSKDQIDQQTKLGKLEQKLNWETMDKEYAMNSPKANKERLKEAGLNPSLMYGSNGGGASTVTGKGVTGAKASNESERKMSNIQAQGMALQNRKMESEINLNNSLAEKNVATKTTEDESRRSVVELVTQQGIEKYLSNIEKNWKINSSNDIGAYNGSGKGTMINVRGKSFIAQEAINMILKAEAEIGNINAQEVLTSEKGKGYFQELVNATMSANANKVRSIALKLASEWNTGEFTNWKTWTELADKTVNTVGNVVSKGVKSKKTNVKVTHNY